MKVDKGFGYKKCGIYCITNSTNKKCYIGSSSHIYYRIRRHKSELQKGVHTNGHLQNAYNKYGSTSFIVTILEECPESNLLSREQHYIDVMCPDYNITKDVIRNSLSPESRKKISETMKAKAKSGIRINYMNDEKRKEIDLYDCNCQHIKRFISYSDAGRFIQKKHPVFQTKTVSTIVNSRYGRYKEYFLIEPSKKCIVPTSKAGNKVLLKKLSDNSIIEFNSATEVAKYLFCAKSAVNRAIKLKRPLLKKYTVELI